MKNFLKKQREIMIISAYACIFAGLLYLVILPLLARINSVNDQIQEESMKQELVTRQLGELPKLQEQYDALGKDVDLTNILLDKNKAVTLIERLEKIAQDSNNKISISVKDAPLAQKSMSTTASTAAADSTLASNLPNPDYLEINIILDGNYNTIMNFIDSLESLEYYSDIIGIKIEQKDARGKSAGYGSFDSYILNLKNNTPTADNASPGDLEASLDAVFYTKK
jgi:hypothetical protein